MDSVLNYLNTTAIGVLFLIITFCLIHFRPSKVGQSREPPVAAGAWPILGHLPLLRRSQAHHITLGAMADKYGPLFTIKLGSIQTLVVSNSEMAKECFATNDMVVSSRPKTVAVENLSYNQAVFGFAPYGPYWRELRKIVTIEFLSNRRRELLGHLRASEVDASLKELFSIWSTRKNESGYVLVEMKQWFAQLTFNIVLRMIVGKRYFGGVMDTANRDEAERFLKTIREFMRLLGVFTVADAIPSLRWLDFGGQEKAMKETAKELDKIMGELLEEHRHKRGRGEKAASDQDFMDVMLSVLNDRRIDGFDADTITKTTSLAMITGGTDTTAVTLTWAMSFLLRNPRTLEKAREELDSQIGKDRCVSESDINKLVYLQAVVKETLRLYPADPVGGPREFTENCTLGGYYVKKGTRLITNLWKIHTDPSIWPNPLEFKPERFLTTHKDVDVRGHHFEFIPFGSGRRMCAGASFGVQALHITLASFLHSFEILNISNEPVDMTGTPGLIVPKATPLEILVKPHLSPNCYETM